MGKYDHLLPYCITPEEHEKIQALIHAGSQRKAADLLGQNHRTIERTVTRLEHRKQKQDAGISALYGEGGGIKQEWIKGKHKNEDQLLEKVNSIVAALKIPKFKPSKRPKPLSADLLNAYIFGDPHLDMLAWMPETGADWDLDIAEQHHISAMTDMIDRSPKCDTAILATMGDLFHRDSLKAITPNGGNLVDVDGRLARSWERGITMLRAMIDKMKKKYQTIYYVCLRGNHSPTLELVLASVIKIAYEDDPQVVVLDNIAKEIPFSFEDNFLLFVHGDGLNDQKKAGLVTSRYRKEHGQAKFSHVLSGHLHHAYQKELNGVLVEIFPVLATSDAWHCENGYMTSDQAASVLTYHKKGGIVHRAITNPRIFLS